MSPNSNTDRQTDPTHKDKERSLGYNLLRYYSNRQQNIQTTKWSEMQTLWSQSETE